MSRSRKRRSLSWGSRLGELQDFLILKKLTAFFIFVMKLTIIFSYSLISKIFCCPIGIKIVPIEEKKKEMDIGRWFYSFGHSFYL